MPTTFQRRVTASLRLTLLHVLVESERAGAPDVGADIQRSAVADFGHRPSRAELDRQIRWLAGEGLVSVRGLDHLVTATITPRGADVAFGREHVDGVRRPDLETRLRADAES